jgi:hypothetical protein
LERDTDSIGLKGGCDWILSKNRFLSAEVPVLFPSVRFYPFFPTTNSIHPQFLPVLSPAIFVLLPFLYATDSVCCHFCPLPVLSAASFVCCQFYPLPVLSATSSVCCQFYPLPVLSAISSVCCQFYPLPVLSVTSSVCCHF